MRLISPIICFFLDHWWSDWLLGYRRCFACGKIQKFDDFIKSMKENEQPNTKNIKSIT